jgi:1-aminocyclopropane-1-carboxylate deaminase
MNVPEQIITFEDVFIKIKREDLLHPFVSGNKFRKLKYNLLEAKNQKKTVLITFGGAFSNHILATAAAGFENGFKTIGVIRGDELVEKMNQNPTLKKASEFGMTFEFVTREEYRKKTTEEFIQKLIQKFGDFYLLPEGGTNDLAIKGCEEILNSDDLTYINVCCAVGTGGTILGVINSTSNVQKVWGFPALKGSFLKEDIRKFANKDNWELVDGYDFGGYGKISDELISFINEFYSNYKIPLDPIYTGKMMFGVFEKIKQGFFKKDEKILVIHTGGLQGIDGMNIALKNKNFNTIQFND